MSNMKESRQSSISDHRKMLAMDSYPKSSNDHVS